MKRPCVVAFLSCAAVSGLLTAAPLCWGLRFSRHPALECVLEDPTTGGFDTWNHLYAHAGQSMDATCPYPDGDAFPKDSAFTGYFYLYASHAVATSQQVFIGDCVTYSTASGGICGGTGWNPAGAVGAFTIKEAPISWQQHPGGFGWTYVNWTATATTAGVTFAGFKATDETF